MYNSYSKLKKKKKNLNLVLSAVGRYKFYTEYLQKKARANLIGIDNYKKIDNKEQIHIIYTYSNVSLYVISCSVSERWPRIMGAKGLSNK